MVNVECIFWKKINFLQYSPTKKQVNWDWDSAHAHMNSFTLFKETAFSKNNSQRI